MLFYRVLLAFTSAERLFRNLLFDGKGIVVCDCDTKSFLACKAELKGHHMFKSKS